MRQFKQRVGFMLVGVLLIIAAGGINAQDLTSYETVTGTIMYFPRAELPPTAEILVELADVSLMDAPAKVIATQLIVTNGRQMPIEFGVSYDRRTIQESHAYAVSARIMVDGELAWISDTRYSVITNDEFEVEIQVVQVDSGDGVEGAMQADTDSEDNDDMGMMANFGTVTGTITYMQRIALPENAIVRVELLDVSLMDAPAFLLAAQQVIANGRQVPFAFSLDYDTGSIVDSGMYSVLATVTVDDELQWTTDTTAPVITNDVYEVELNLVQVGESGQVDIFGD
jgi:putative lipoprotein